jgi:hypothetical protein
MPKSTVTNNRLGQSSTTSSSTIVDKINMLRGFVSNDAFSETDLSQCLRQANYNVDLAAERLMTGQFQPTKRHKTTPSIRSPPTPTLSNGILHQTPGAATSRTSTPVTPNVPLTSKVVEKTSNPVTKKASPPMVGGRSLPKVAPSSQGVVTTVDDDSGFWLLCHRWISDGICLQRNGCLSYQEALSVEILSNSHHHHHHSNNHNNHNHNHNHNHNNHNNHKGTVPTVRFRGTRMVGQFPRRLHPILGPLLEKNLIQVRAQALMEDRFLPTGVDVAFGVWYVLIQTHDYDG